MFLFNARYMSRVLSDILMTATQRLISFRLSLYLRGRGPAAAGRQLAAAISGAACLAVADAQPVVTTPTASPPSAAATRSPFTGSLAASTALPKASLKGPQATVTVTPEELEMTFLLPDSLDLPRSNEAIADAAELLLLPKLWAASSEATSLTGGEARYVQQRADAARLRGWYDLLEARAVRRIAADPKGLEARAREVYAERMSRLPATLIASITVIDVQFAKHGFDGSLVRLTAARAALAAGKGFDDVVREFSDATATSGAAMGAIKEPTFSVDRDSVDGALRTAAFRDLKPGETSGPIPVATGFVIVRLNSREPREKPSLESLRNSIENEIRADVVAKARTAGRIKLGTDPVVFDPPLSPNVRK